MALDQEQIRELAAGLIREENDFYEYSNVYESDDVLDATENEDDWRAIHDAMSSAKITITFDGTEY